MNMNSINNFMVLKIVVRIFLNLRKGCDVTIK
jgi:hypothetical protein